MDELIQSIVKALGVGASLEDIHDAIIEKGWTEENAFLAIKAGENLYDAIVAQELALKNKPPPFGRQS